LIEVSWTSSTQQMWFLGQEVGVQSIFFLMSNVLEPLSNSHGKNISTQKFESD